MSVPKRERQADTPMGVAEAPADLLGEKKSGPARLLVAQEVRLDDDVNNISEGGRWIITINYWRMGRVRPILVLCTNYCQ